MQLGKLPPFLKRSLILACIGVLLVLFPVIQWAVLLPLQGLLDLYDVILPGESLLSSPHVQVHFLGLFPTSPQAFLFFWSFFFFTSLLMHGISYLLSKSRVRLIIALSRVLAVLIVVGASLAIFSIRADLKREADWAALDVPTETHFVCSLRLSLRVFPDGEVYRYEVLSNVPSRSLIGEIDEESSKFTWTRHTNSFAEETKAEIMSSFKGCKNVNSATFFDLYAK
jgi:hypothetical protein